MPPLNDETKLLQQEAESNDPSIVWPSIQILQQLPADWLPEQGSGGMVHTDEHGNGTSGAPSKREEDTNKIHKHCATQVSRKKRSKKLQDRQETNSSILPDKLQHANTGPRPPPQQPYYLNHVRGSTRLRQASQRLAAAIGTLFATYLLCNPSLDTSSSSSSPSSPFIKFEDVGLQIISFHRVLFDIFHGILIGSTIVVMIFGVELYMGWIRIVGFCEKVVSDEKFVLNLLWDALFHVGVSVNEEVM